MKIWKSPMRSPVPYCGCPSTMIATSAEVPPISRLMQRGMPATSATYAAPITPDAVPDRIISASGSCTAFWITRFRGRAP